jgi:hypothetical protein
MVVMEKAREMAAQLWCDDRVSDREMDTEFAEVIAEKFSELMHLGNPKKSSAAFLDNYPEVPIPSELKRLMDDLREESRKVNTLVPKDSPDTGFIKKFKKAASVVRRLFIREEEY